MDALFTAHFVRKLVLWHTPNFNFIMFVRRALYVLMPLIRSTSECETLNMATFLLELFGDLSKMMESEKVFREWSDGNCCFLKSINAPENGYIGYEMFSRQTKNRALLYARALASMRFCLGDRLAFITVTQKDLAETDTDKSHTEGFVDFALTIEGVEVSVAVLEVKRGQYKISLRSKRANVNAVASEFGGGGHVLASGCMLFGEYEEVIDRLSYAVSKQL